MDQNLVTNYESPRVHTPCLMVNSNKCLRLIAHQDIIFLEVDSNYCLIHSQNCKTIMTSKTLKYWQQRLSSDMFIRVHHSYLVNSKYIAAIHKSIQSIELINGTYLKISRSKKQFLNTTIKNTLEVIAKQDEAILQMLSKGMKRE